MSPFQGAIVQRLDLDLKIAEDPVRDVSNTSTAQPREEQGNSWVDDRIRQVF